MTTPHATRRAILMALTGFTLWTFGDSLMKMAVKLGTPNYEALGLTGFAGLLAIFIVTALRGKQAALRPKSLKGMAIIGVFYVTSSMAWILAYPTMPLANIYAVSFMAPVVIAVLAMIFLRESMDARKILAILAGFAGVIIAIDPASLMHHAGSWFGYGAIFTGMLSIAIQMLLLRVYGRTESREAMAFYPRIASLIGSGGACLVFGYQSLTWAGAGCAMGSGVVGGLGWIFIAQAYKLAPANTVAPFQYWQMVVGALLGYLLWGEVPNAHIVTGTFIIVASGIYLVTHLRRMARRQAALAENP